MNRIKEVELTNGSSINKKLIFLIFTHLFYSTPHFFFHFKLFLASLREAQRHGHPIISQHSKQALELPTHIALSDYNTLPNLFFQLALMQFSDLTSNVVAPKTFPSVSSQFIFPYLLSKNPLSFYFIEHTTICNQIFI